MWWLFKCSAPESNWTPRAFDPLGECEDCDEGAGPFAVPWFANVSSITRPRLERENHTGLEAKITLIVIAVCERIAKPGQNVIELTWANRDGLGDLDVQAPTNNEIECVVGGRIQAAHHTARI
jgi:hypothetical protein